MTMTQETGVRPVVGRIDLDIVAGLVTPESRVLDLGCGDGALLDQLIRTKRVIGRGVEISDVGVRTCIARGISVHLADVDEGLGDYPDQSFDFVILSQTLQTVYYPSLVLREMLRVGRAGIVSFPNFGYWKVRWELFATGRMPKADYLPYEWYDTPNIHLLTVKDFAVFCAENGFTIQKAIFLCDGQSIRVAPNLRAKEAIFLIRNGH